MSTFSYEQQQQQEKQRKASVEEHNSAAASSGAAASEASSSSGEAGASSSNKKNRNPIPPPFNPLTSTTTTTAETVVGESVVPCLMQVYESMTGTATTTTTEPPAATEAAAAAANAGYYGASAWNPPGAISLAGSTIPIPPVPNDYNNPIGTTAAGVADPMAAQEQAQHQQQQSLGNKSYVTSASPTPEPVTSRTGLSGTSSNQTTTTPSGRSLRKRTLRDAADGGGLGVMAAAVGAVSAASSGRSSKSRRKSTSSVGSGGASDRGGGTAASDVSKSGGASTAGGSNDGRWSKRFSWPEELHRDFVAAIFDVGLKHSSPSTLLEQMPKHEQITTERIKSHLQKYRLHRVKSKKEFMASYDASLKKFQAPDTPATSTALSGGQVAGHLTRSVMEGSSIATEGKESEEEPQHQNTTAQAADAARPAAAATVAAGEQDQQTQLKPKSGNDAKSAGAPAADAVASSSQQQPSLPNETLMLPRLTEAEKKSPIGAAMGYLMGLFFSLKQQLMAQRVAEAIAAEAVVAAKQQQQDQQQHNQQQQSATTPAAAVYNAFVTGQPSSVLQTAAPVAAPGGPPVGDPPTAPVLDPLNAAATAAAATATTATNPSTRTNLEENSIMKREMQNQMVFQNKMRALKQQELEKYSNNNSGGANTSAVMGMGAFTAAGTQAPAPSADLMPPPQAGDGATNITTSPGAGVEEHGRGLSIGGSDDFWNTDGVDDQLFEFLMSDA
ncbi:hypothetical protein ACA910_006759 [Epithemia clementina (nom. ined.)]